MVSLISLSVEKVIGEGIGTENCRRAYDEGISKDNGDVMPAF
jgi:hypothetical protein